RSVATRRPRTRRARWRAGAPTRPGTRPAPRPARAAPGWQDHATRSWELAQHGLTERDLEQEQAERRPEEPGVPFPVVEELGRLEGRLLGPIDLGVDVVQALRVGRPEVLGAGGLGDLLEGRLVGVDRDRPVHRVADEGLHGKR